MPGIGPGIAISNVQEYGRRESSCPLETHNTDEREGGADTEQGSQSQTTPRVAQTPGEQSGTMAKAHAGTFQTLLQPHCEQLQRLTSFAGEAKSRCV